ncbi:MAG: UDP-N-acetylglucosamine 2-epimerase [Candidatus Omnitrophica bacterium]|nr:UDP-N-acetylglucosamine 2-epimerase [Candidatus Omnitrophota bacterium]MDD5429928.1 UDP-N-acetylglucosamine 2-epimerase [Candidatus Omnitrophota bacterium]
MKKIGVITTGRCDYSIYFPILKEIKASSSLNLILYVTGMHLFSRYGDSLNSIKKDGFLKIKKVFADFSSDTPLGVTKAMGEVTNRFGKAFEKEKPDILLVLGDRFEMHAAALAAIPFKIPIAHIHGGELTYGSFDEYFRHSLTKLSYFHFVSTKVYAKRVRQMGEAKERIIVSGAPGLDNISKIHTQAKEELEKKFKINFSKPVLLVTFHPVTSEYGKTKEYIAKLLKALSLFSDYNIVFTSPNADMGSKAIRDKIKKFARRNSNAFYVENFGRAGYLSMMKNSAAMVGNSSSGIIEAASFKLPVVNIGRRQEGRIRGRNVIDTGYEIREICAGIRRATSKKFRASLKGIKNPYGDGKAAKRIVAILKRVKLKAVRPKYFCDL